MVPDEVPPIFVWVVRDFLLRDKIKLKTSPKIKKIDIWDENGKERILTVHRMNIFIMICYGIMQIKRLR